MRVALIVPGSGESFYCENCLRDSSLAAGLARAGFETVPVPLYLPSIIRRPGDRRQSPLFYGAIALYLRQRFPLIRRLPAAFDRLFNARPFIALAAGLAGSTRAAGLEEMTISMLRGAGGNQAAELDALVRWLEREVKPDIVHLSNALLLGLAPTLKARLEVPVVCSLQDEHVWIDPMGESARERVWSLLTEQARCVDRFVAVSEYYKKEMAPKLKLNAAAIAVVPLGVDEALSERRATAPERPVIGFLSRIEEDSGLDDLVEALAHLIVEPALHGARLRVYGGLTADDRPYLRRVKAAVRRFGLTNEVSIVTGYDRVRRFDFLRRLSVLCVPRRAAEAFGMFLIEALALGVPVVAPALGGFPEIVERTQGGLLYPALDAKALADALRRVLGDRSLAFTLGKNGAAGVREWFSAERTAKETGAIYRSLVD